MLFGMAVLAMVGNIKTAAFKNYRCGMDDAPRFAPALGTHRYRLFIKTLFPLKTKLALAALVLVDRQISPHTLLQKYFSALASKEANNRSQKSRNSPRLAVEKGVKFN
jgi:hypothetical protein